MQEILGILNLGMVYGFVALGLLMTLRIIDFPDLTVNSSFTLGGRISASLLVYGLEPGLVTIIAFAAGGAAGLVTAFLYNKCKVPNLLAGIITMIGLYSINLHIMGKPNIAFIEIETLYSYCKYESLLNLLLLATIAVSVIYFLLS